MCHFWVEVQLPNGCPLAMVTEEAARSRGCSYRRQGSYWPWCLNEHMQRDLSFPGQTVMHVVTDIRRNPCCVKSLDFGVDLLLQHDIVYHASYNR